MMTRSRRRFWKRLFAPLALAVLALVLTVPAQAIDGGPVGEKAGGLWQPQPTAVPGADDKLIVEVPSFVPQGDDKVVEAPPLEPLKDDKVLAAPPAAALHPDGRAERPGPGAGAGEPGAFPWVKGDGLQPGQLTTVNERGIDWTGLGIALAVSFASILTAAIVVRRRRGTLAHR